MNVNTDISDFIKKIINEHYGDLENNQKSKLIAIVSLNVFSLPYYRDFYEQSFISIQQDGDVKTEYLDLNISTANDDKHNYFRHHFADLDALYVKGNNVEHYKTLLSSIIFSDSVIQHVVKLKEESDKNEEFFKFLLNNFDYFWKIDFPLVFSHSEFKNIFRNDSGSFLSELKGSEIFLNEKEAQFLKHKKQHSIQIKSLMSNIKRLKDLEKEYEQELTYSLIKIKEAFPYLFNIPTLDTISYEFFEIQDCKNKADPYFVNENKSIFKKKILEKYGIKKKKIIKSDGFHTHSTDFYNYISRQDNELNNNFRHELYGLDFLERDIFDREENEAFFLVAKNNNEVVGVIAFESMNNYDSFFSSIGSCVKINHRGLGLSKIMYGKVASIFEELDLTFINDHYSFMGQKRLRKYKQELNKKYKKGFFLDTCLTAFQDYSDPNIVQKFAKTFLKALLQVNIEKNCNINASLIKSSYFKHLERINGSLDRKDAIDYEQLLIELKKEIIQKINNTKTLKP